jgi:hypothetical protein
LRHPIDDAINGVADVLLGSDEQACSDQDDDGRLVVKPEHIVVDPYGVELDQVLDRTKCFVHFLSTIFSIT